jgi:hypothetical protein
MLLDRQLAAVAYVFDMNIQIDGYDNVTVERINTKFIRTERRKKKCMTICN